MEQSIDGRTIRLVRADITTLAVDAIVNAANEALLPGGGVCGAIHRRGGPAIAAECYAIGSCPTGDAVATTAGELPASHVIHAVAPIWRDGKAGESRLLACAYRRSLEVAGEIGARSVAFPSLGTGIYGYPVEKAAPIALGTVAGYLRGPTTVEVVTFALFSDHDLHVYEAALAAIPRDM